jgi:hypothetical protein
MAHARILSALAAALSIWLIAAPLAQAEDELTILEAWMASPHAKSASPAFTHWNEEGEIPANCATCHSGIGFRDFLGADGSAPGVIDHRVPVGSKVDCETCHNDVAMSLSTVTFPSGITVDAADKGAVCMVCHQGTQSTVNVNTALGKRQEDKVDPELGFINVHYRAAAATMLGTEAKGAYEYPGKTYMGRFTHVPQFSSCIDCHDPHSLKAEVAQCVGCHQVDELKAIRSSTDDFDDDGDVSEGMAAEIDQQVAQLYDAIQAYARDVIGAPIIYAEAYPYFFADKDGDGTAGPGEAIYPNRYQSWTPRLLKAAYNYQFVTKDPGAYAHNPHYALQVLFDSIESLAEHKEVRFGGQRGFRPSTIPGRKTEHGPNR